MKKLILFLLLVTSSFAQNVEELLKLRGGGFYSYTPSNVAATVSEGQIIFSGASTRAKSTKLLGTLRAPSRYLRYGYGYSVTDSVSGYSKVLTSVLEDSVLVYSQSVYYTNGAGTTLWYAADTDTTYSLVNSSNFQTVEGGDEEIYCEWLDESESEVGFEISYKDTSDESYTVFDTTAADIVSAVITPLDSGIYAVRMRTIGHNTNSDYSDVWYTDVSDSVDVGDTTAPSAPTLVDAFNISSPPEPPDTVPIFTPTSFTGLTNIGIDSLITSNGMALSSLDSCYAYAAGDSFKVGIYGDTVTAYTMVYENDTLYCIKSSSGDFSTTVTCSLTVGGVLKTWAITTGGQPPSGEYSVWYVDKDATGANTGRSWEDAWVTMDSLWTYPKYVGINWDIIQAGDTIYISGGSTSKDYPAQVILGDWDLKVLREFDSEVVICPSWEEGHNGTVTFLNTDTTVRRTIFHYQVSDLKWVNINFRASVENSWLYGSLGGQSCYALETPVKDITFENCTFINDSTGSALVLKGENIVVDNCLITNLPNTNLGDNDILTIRDGAGGHTIRNSRIYQMNQNTTTSSHKDLIQIGGQFGSPVWTEGRWLETRFENNIIWANVPNGNNWNCGIYYSSGLNNTNQSMVFINNIMNLDCQESVNAFMTLSSDSTSIISMKLYNNTIIAPGVTLSMNTIDTVIAKNNIFIQRDYIPNFRMMLIGQSAYRYNNRIYKDLDYNLYYIYNWDSDEREIWGSIDLQWDWGEWQATGQDVNSDTGYISLTEVTDSLISSYATPDTCLGTDLSAIFTTDINGDTRSTWYKGAVNPAGSMPFMLWKKIEPFIKGDWESTDWWREK